MVLVDGRRPASDTEIVLAPSTANLLAARPGSRLELAGAQGRQRKLTVVGIGFVPVGPHNDYDSGGWVRSGAFDALFGSAFTFRTALIALTPGAVPDVVAARLARLAATVGAGQVEFTPPQPPSVVGELRQVGVLPLALGYFLVVLALGAVGHALATTVRRKRVDVAVLRALGMTRWQSRGVVVTQASVLALVGLALGVPLGVALGRTVWRGVAEYTPMQYAPPSALLALLLVAPGALLVANLLAAWPGHQAARLRIGHVLRAP
jgi:predicted lysophospholipase L1 biosynthesis ABC-type transport system permease subunit